MEDGREVEADIALDTGKLLFICGGAFEELYDQVYGCLVNRRDDRRLREVSEVERKADGSVSVRTVVRFKLRDYLRLADLFTYGMMPQFISRFGSIAMLDDLGKDELRQILVGAANSPLRLCLEYFRHMGIKLLVTDAALTLISEAAAKNSRIGARALREIFNGLIAPHAAQLFSKRHAHRARLLAVLQQPSRHLLHAFLLAETPRPAICPGAPRNPSRSWPRGPQ